MISPGRGENIWNHHPENVFSTCFNSWIPEIPLTHCSCDKSQAGQNMTPRTNDNNHNHNCATLPLPRLLPLLQLPKQHQQQQQQQQQHQHLRLADAWGLGHAFWSMRAKNMVLSNSHKKKALCLVVHPFPTQATKREVNSTSIWMAKSVRFTSNRPSIESHTTRTSGWRGFSLVNKCHPWNEHHKHSTWNTGFGRWVAFWEGRFSGAMSGFSDGKTSPLSNRK